MSLCKTVQTGGRIRNEVFAENRSIQAGVSPVHSRESEMDSRNGSICGSKKRAAAVLFQP